MDERKYPTTLREFLIEKGVTEKQLAEMYWRDQLDEFELGVVADKLNRLFLMTVGQVVAAKTMEAAANKILAAAERMYPTKEKILIVSERIEKKEKTDGEEKAGFHPGY